MHDLRALIRNRRHLAMALLVLAFCFRALVPAGFMVSPRADTVLTMSICADASGGAQHLKIVIPVRDEGNAPFEHAAKNAPCAFSGLNHAAIAGADPVLLAIAFAFILVFGLAPAGRLPLRKRAQLRPPLRGPPAFA